MGAPPKAPPVYKPTLPRLAAPPVYRPNQVNAPSAQLKPGANFKLETRPAPPVYRPGEAATPTTQLKPANSFRLETRPAPPVFHPQQVQSRVQPKTVNPFCPETRPAPPAFQSLQVVKVPSSANPLLQNIQAFRPDNHFTRRTLPIPRFNRFREPIQRMELPEFGQAGTPLERLERTVGSLKGSQVTESGFFAPYSAKQKTDKLFAEFLGIGIGYDLGNAFSSTVLGEGAKPLRPGEEMRKAFSGNCLAMAKALAKVFTMAGVSAEPKEVRAEVAGRAFVVHAPNFVDKKVTGHIFKDNILWAQRYLFTNHTATWVPSLNTYYDLMSGATYQNLDAFIEMELTQVDAKGNIFEGQYEGRPWRLQRRTDIKGPEGGFFRFDMAPAPPPVPLVVPPGFVATPLGVFREGN